MSPKKHPSAVGNNKTEVGKGQIPTTTIQPPKPGAHPSSLGNNPKKYSLSDNPRGYNQNVSAAEGPSSGENPKAKGKNLRHVSR